LHLVVYNYRKTSDGYLYFSIEYFKFGDEATYLIKISSMVDSVELNKYLISIASAPDVSQVMTI